MLKNDKDTPKTMDAMKVEVAFPECVHIELVQANDLKHYEIFLWLFSLALSVAAGFWVAFVTTPFNKVLLSTSLAFTAVALGFAWAAYYYRSRIGETKLKKVVLLENFSNN